MDFKVDGLQPEELAILLVVLWVMMEDGMELQVTLVVVERLVMVYSKWDVLEVMVKELAVKCFFDQKYPSYYESMAVVIGPLVQVATQERSKDLF